MKILRFFILFIIITFIIFLIHSCARMSSPSGGPKDVDPPVPLKSSPVNYSTNFNLDKIIVQFDEYIVLKDIGQELLVSPPLENKPEIRLRGKNLIIKVNNKLKDSTTYNFNFYNAIVDLNEGNKLKNFQFEFSTGDKFDSLYVGGIMHDAFSYKREKGLYVMLYSSFNDSIPRTTLPDYIAKTDEEGKFFVTNLKKQPYYIFGLKDMNNNMMFDMPNESIAFIDSVIIPDFEEKITFDTIKIIESISANYEDTVWVDSIVQQKQWITTVDSMRLFMFTEEFKQQYFRKSYRPEEQQVIFVFNENLDDSVSIIPIAEKYDKQWYYQEKAKKNDSLIFWITDSVLYKNDSLLFQVNYTMVDSNQNNYIRTDTMLLVYKKKKNKKSKGLGKTKKTNRFKSFLAGNNSKEETKKDTIIPPSELTFKHNAKSPFDLNKQITFDSRFPIDIIKISNIILYKYENDSVKNKIEYSLIRDSLNKRKFTIDFDKYEEETFELLIPAGTITDLYGNINDTLDLKFTTRAYSYYSVVSMNFVGVKEKSIIQVLTEKDELIIKDSIYYDTTLIFDYLTPKKYKFRLFYDSNNNGKWDTGNFKELKQPERVFYYPFLPELLDVKENMEIENTWYLYPKKDK